jgi:hypothetical protein
LSGASLRKRLWLGAAGVVLFIATVFGAHAVMTGDTTASHVAGLDFLSFYTAGSAVREGRTADLYNLNATRRFQAKLGDEDRIPIGDRYAPWWNPPFYALPFALLASMSFHAALWAWLIANMICAGVACWILCRIMPEGTDWRSWGLVPVLMAISMPFVENMTHGQNSCTSLLILTVTTWYWRAGRAVVAGMTGGLLFYKPQLAVVVAGMMILDLGWRAALGTGVTGVILLVLNLLALPGTLGDFLRQVPANLHFVQEQSAYPWARHVTFKGFWRVLLQGEGVGPTWHLANLLSGLGMAVVGTILIRAAIRRSDAQSRFWRRDRLIAATIAATPLLMPFYFDYDLLLLAVPATLLSCEIARTDAVTSADRWLIGLLGLLYAWLMINPDIAEKTQVNLAVPLLAAVVLLFIRRVHAQTTELAASIEPRPILSPSIST